VGRREARREGSAVAAELLPVSLLLQLLAVRLMAARLLGGRLVEGRLVGGRMLPMLCRGKERRVQSVCVSRYSVYLLYWYKVQILTPKVLRADEFKGCERHVEYE
jgi:hypothetical protein